MIRKFMIALVGVGAFFVSGAGAQTKTRVVTPMPPPAAVSVKTSAAFAEVLLRKTDVGSELESLLVEYTEDYPKVRELRFEAAALQKEIARLETVTDSARLSAALGRMMIRKCQLATELFVLQAEFNDQHPDVKRAKRRVEVYEAAIVEILSAK